MRSSLFPSTISYSTPLYDRTHTFRTPLRSYNTNNIDLIRPQVQKKVLSSQLCSVRNYDRTVRDRFFDKGQHVFVRQYLGPQNGLVDKFYVDQDLSLTTSKLEIKYIRVRHLNFYKTVPEIKTSQILNKNNFWIFIHLRDCQKVKLSSNLERNFKFRIKPKRVGEPQAKSEQSTSTTHSKGQHNKALPPTFQRASTSTRAPEVVVPPPTRSLRARETLKQASKIDHEFSGLGSKKIK